MQSAGARQLALDLSHIESFAREDFLSSRSNADALAMVTRWPDLALLVVEYRAPLLLEITFLPPLGALGVMLFVMARRRRTQLAARERSPRTAFAHG